MLAASQVVILHPAEEFDLVLSYFTTLPGIACQADGCTYNTADHVDENATVTDHLTLLHIHTNITHLPGGRAADRAGADGLGTQQSGRGKPNKLVTPKLEMGVGPDVFSFWRDKWNTYKHSSGLTDVGAICDQLTSCYSKEIY